MALEFGFPSADGLTGHAAARRDFEGMVARNAGGVMRAGVFYAHGNDLITRRPDMKLDIPDFRAVQDKGGACFIAGVGVTTTPAFAAAPAANKRIDLLYLTQELPTIDSTTEIIFGIVTGTASPTPVRPSLPAARSDAIPWAAVEIPAGATSMQSAGVIITPLYPYTAMAGGTVVVRNLVELGAWTPAPGSRAFCLADTGDYVRQGSEWQLTEQEEIGAVTAVTGASIYATHANRLVKRGSHCVLNVTIQGGGVAGVCNVPPDFRPLLPTVIGIARGSSGTLVGNYFLQPSGLISIIYFTGTADSGTFWPIAGSWQI